MSAALKLEIYQNGELLREVPFEKEELWIGRGDDCVIRLEDRAISRRHGSLKATEQGMDFEKKSKFGLVRVNGKEVEQASLKNGDRMEMGPYEIRVLASVIPVTIPEAVATAKAALPEVEIKTTAIEMSSEEISFVSAEASSQIDFGNSGSQLGMGESTAAISEPVVNPGEKTGAFDFSRVENDGATAVLEAKNAEMKPVLQFGDGAANVTQYEISDNEVAIGRSQKCHIVLEDKRSSRKHSIIRREGNKFSVQDLGSANGTLVNGVRIDEQQELHSGDVLQIGDTQFTFQMVQADYEQKKDQFIQVVQESTSIPVAPPEMMPMMDASQAFASDAFIGQAAPVGAAPAAPDFSAPEGEKKSFIGKFLDRYRAMNTKQQIIWGLAILAGVYYMLDDDSPQKKPHMNMGQAKVVQTQKKGDKKSGSGPTFESLTQEQQRYIETEYQLCFDFYKNREYDSALLEVGKIFSLVQDYKNAREIETFAREGKRKLEAQEEERKKKELERQAEIKLQSLLEQAGLLMEKKRFAEAEALFPEIELIQPENAAVGTWRKQMMVEKERLEAEVQAQKMAIQTNKEAWADFAKAKLLANDKKYWDALDAYDAVAARSVPDKKFAPAVQAETKRVEDLIAADRDPVFVQAKQLEQDGKLSEAYRTYQKVIEIDPTYTAATDGMTRIRGSITGRAKVIYAEGVFAESFSDMDTAEKRYREVMEVVPTDDPYYIKAQSRLKKLLVFRQPLPVVTNQSGDTPAQ
jgi:pSer/pThr/pTyr-binding forkhead associated (FHA) protein/tetratricopeptide (TPR) repeat protein